MSGIIAGSSATTARSFSFDLRCGWLTMAIIVRCDTLVSIHRAPLLSLSCALHNVLGAFARVSKRITNLEVTQLAGRNKGTSRITTWRVSLKASRNKGKSTLVTVSSPQMIRSLRARHAKNYLLLWLHVSCNTQVSDSI